MLTLLLGFVGLVVDVGILVSAHRQLQNAADAAAMAAATEKMNGASDGEAIGVGKSVVASYSDSIIPNPTATIITPTTAADAFYVGPNYVKAIVSAQVHTYFIQLVGVGSQHEVAASAVAGFETHVGGGGVAVLDHRAIPGLSVQGNSELWVNGKILVNSEGSGWSEDNVYIDTGKQTYAATTGNRKILARMTRVVGGVDVPSNYAHIEDPNRRALQTQQPHFLDPLANLDTPYLGNGVAPYSTGFPYAADSEMPYFTFGVPVQATPDVDNETVDPADPWTVDWHTTSPWYRGTVKTVKSDDPTNPGVDPSLLDAQGRYLNDPERLNRVRDIDIDGDGAAENVLVLHPGIYQSIQMNGGRIALMPGVYVIQPAANAPQKIVNSLKVVAADPASDVFWAKGVMFYVTGNNYDVADGSPDIWKDSSKVPPARDPLASVAAVNINTALTMTPINTRSESPYLNIYDQFGPTEMKTFEGMLFYQRRWNDAGLTITGDASEGVLSGTIYARWSLLTISGQGTYDAQFILGSMAVTGNGRVTVLNAGPEYGRAPRVYLVE